MRSECFKNPATSCDTVAPGLLPEDDAYPPSGVIVQAPRDAGDRTPLKLLWKALPVGLVTLGSFVPVEADTQYMPVSTTVSSCPEYRERAVDRGETGTPLTLNEAALVASQVFERAKRQRQAERRGEARFLASLWQDDEL